MHKFQAYLGYEAQILLPLNRKLDVHENRVKTRLPESWDSHGWQWDQVQDFLGT